MIPIIFFVWLLIDFDNNFCLFGPCDISSLSKVGTALTSAIILFGIWFKSPKTAKKNQNQTNKNTKLNNIFIKIAIIIISLPLLYILMSVVVSSIIKILKWIGISLY